MLRTSRFLCDALAAKKAAHEAAQRRQFELLARRKGLYSRGFVGKVVGGSFLAFCAYFPLAIMWADRKEEDGHTLANSTSYHMLEAVPIDTISRGMGAIAGSQFIPQWVHKRMIAAVCSLYSVDLSDFSPEDQEGWATLQDWFTRKLRADARVIDSDAFVTSPCDGEVIKWGVVDSTNRMVQVKGCSYTVQNLFRSACDRPDPSANTERYYFAFRMGPQDYHRFHSPAAFQPFESVHSPGYLFPVMRAATKWIPMLYVNNERVILNGVLTAPNTAAAAKATTKAKSSSAKPSPMAAVAAAGGKLAIAFIGASCVGGIHLNMDNRVSTNLVDPPPYALHRKYDKSVAPLVAKGEELGYFSIGSAIVMIVDVPKDAPVVITEGQHVKIGQALIKASA